MRIVPGVGIQPLDFTLATLQIRDLRVGNLMGPRGVYACR